MPQNNEVKIPLGNPEPLSTELPIDPPPYQQPSPDSQFHQAHDQSQPDHQFQEPTSSATDSAAITSAPIMGPLVMTSDGIVRPVIVTSEIGKGPTPTTCQVCNHLIISRAEVKFEKKTHFLAGALCILGGLLCCWIPYVCIKSWRRVDHHCPNCGAFLGSHRF